MAFFSLLLLMTTKCTVSHPPGDGPNNSSAMSPPAFHIATSQGVHSIIITPPTTYASPLSNNQVGSFFINTASAR